MPTFERRQGAAGFLMTLLWMAAAGSRFLRCRGAAAAFSVTPSLKHHNNAHSSLFRLAHLSSTATRNQENEVMSSSPSPPAQPFKVNIHTASLEEIETLMQAWGFPKYRAGQIVHWIREKGALSFDEMNNLPAKLRTCLNERATIGSLELDTELVSKDGTRKRVYRLAGDENQLIESVLMPYEDGRNTACISSQAGCAMGCVFCATGQMGFARQLTEEEIFEQVARFASELKRDGKRLSNVVMMGMGEPLANYRNVMGAIRRMNDELGIGARKITVSTVGVVPNIRKLMQEPTQVRLAVSLHCSSDEERSALLPANKRYGGLDELMSTIREYIEVSGRRVTFEWALISGTNDTPEVARSLGKLLRRHGIRRDMGHINLIPLNPTGGYAGGPSARDRVNDFVSVLEKEFGISATPRVRRGIDIEAGCGQLKAAVEKKKKSLNGEEATNLEIAELQSFVAPTTPSIGVYDDDEADLDMQPAKFTIDDSQVVNLDSESFDEDMFENPEFQSEEDIAEAARLIELVHASFPAPPATPAKSKTTSIVDEDALLQARRRRKKLIRNLKQVRKLREKEENGGTLNEEQLIKVGREKEWELELESVEHNLK